jgi:parallel beta-helix repeat protein
MLRKKAACSTLLVLFLLLLSGQVCANFVPPPEGTPYGTICIKADGSISVDRLSPSSVPLSRSGDHYTLSGNITDYGFRIERDNVILNGAGFSIVAANWYAPFVGVNLTSRNGVTVRNLGIAGFNSAIVLNGSSNNVLEGNRIKNSENDLSLINSSTDNMVIGNSMTGATFQGHSIYIADSAGNTFRNNNVTNGQRNYYQPSTNKLNFLIECSNTTHLSDLTQDIDSSNTLDGKPMCYWVNQNDKAVPSDAGYVALVNCNNIAVTNLSLADNGQGLLLAATTNSTVNGNRITGNSHGIVLLNSHGNTFTGNEIAQNVYGVTFYSSDNIFSSNRFSENEREHANFRDGYQNIMDASNTVNGAPLCYWVNQYDKTVPPDAGYVFLVNCSRILVQNLNIRNQLKGLYLVSTSNSLLINNSLVDNDYGICLTDSHNNKIIKNRLSGNNENSLSISASDGNIVSENEVILGYVGLYVANSTGNMFSRNNISNNNYTGVEIFGSSGNSFFENRVEGNGRAGIAMRYSSNNNLLVGNNVADNGFVNVDLNNAQNNTFYRNSFKMDIVIRNGHPRTHQILDMWADVVITTTFQLPSYNIWDNGVEGNFWSDFNGSDVDANGMGDTPYFVDTSMHDGPIIMGGKTYSFPRSVDTLDRDHYPFMKSLPMAHETQLAVLTPENGTYDLDEAQLTFTVSEEGVQVFYSLDLQEEQAADGNLTLSGLSKGSHSLLVWTNDTSGTPANFQVISFETTKETSTAQTPEVTSSPSEPPAEKPETNVGDTAFPILLAATVAVVVLAIVAVVLVVFRRVRRPHQQGPSLIALRHDS